MRGLDTQFVEVMKEQIKLWLLVLLLLLCFVGLSAFMVLFMFVLFGDSHL